MQSPFFVACVVKHSESASTSRVTSNLAGLGCGLRSALVATAATAATTSATATAGAATATSTATSDAAATTSATSGRATSAAVIAATTAAAGHTAIIATTAAAGFAAHFRHAARFVAHVRRSRHWWGGTRFRRAARRNDRFVQLQWRFALPVTGAISPGGPGTFVLAAARSRGKALPGTTFGGGSRRNIPLWLLRWPVRLGCGPVAAGGEFLKTPIITTAAARGPRRAAIRRRDASLVSGRGRLPVGASAPVFRVNVRVRSRRRTKLPEAAAIAPVGLRARVPSLGSFPRSCLVLTRHNGRLGRGPIRVSARHSCGPGGGAIRVTFRRFRCIHASRSVVVVGAWTISKPAPAAAISVLSLHVGPLPCRALSLRSARSAGAAGRSARGA